MPRKKSEPMTEPTDFEKQVAADKAASNTAPEMPDIALTPLPPPVAFDPHNPEVYVHRHVPTGAEGEEIFPGFRRINY